MYDFILNSIEKILGDKIDNIIRHNSTYCKISYGNKKYTISIKLNKKMRRPKNIDEFIKFELANIQVNPNLTIKINDHNEFTYDIRQDDIYLDNFMISNNYLESKFIRSFFYQLITFYRTSNLNYIPPSRSLILQNIHYFSSEKFQSSSNKRINDLVLNFIQNLNESLTKKPLSGAQNEHLEYFFNEILGGRINVDWEYSRRKIEFVENEITTPIERSASMVQELSSIPLLLSGSESDEIIIEEPEAHLHPFAQLEFIKWLVMYINYETTQDQNVNVILTSHSPLITAQLDNILIATELLGNKPNNMFDETQLISKELVNMYLLKRDDDGFISDLNPINRDGFDRDVFGEVNKLLYEEYGEIIDLSNEE